MALQCSQREVIDRVSLYEQEGGMPCPQCQHENPDGSRFYNACGVMLELTCSACHHLNPPGSRVCNACGHNLVAPAPQVTQSEQAATTGQEREPLAYTPQHLADKILTSRSALEGERKQVTVWFADVTGFSTLSEQLEAEAVHIIMDGCFDLLTRRVHHYEGTVNQYTGNGIMALFGAPITHEDHATRAFRRSFFRHDRAPTGTVWTDYPASTPISRSNRSRLSRSAWLGPS